MAKTEFTIHTMHLDDEPFRKICDGSKTIELRLYDERRRLIRVGDFVRFENRSGVVKTKVTALYVFDDFRQLYSSLDLTKCGYSSDELPAASPDDMLAYYTLKQQRKWGVVGIETELVQYQLYGK